jgi:cell division protein YceG involved in septum cleavage
MALQAIYGSLTRFNPWGLFFVLGISLSYFGCHLWYFAQIPLRIQHRLIYYLKPNATIYHLTADFIEKGILKNPRLFLILAYLKNAANNLQAGEYQLEVGMTPGQCLDRIKAGMVKLHRFTLVEGWTWLRHFRRINVSRTH